MSEEQVGEIVYQVQMDVAQLLTAQQQVNDRLDKMDAGFNKTSRAASSADRTFASLSKTAAALSAALSASQVAAYADAWTTLNNKLANSVRTGEALIQVTQRVFDIAQETRAGLDATASLYARLERATRSYGASIEDVSRLTTIINQAFVVSGATAEEAAGATLQLSQGLASGVVRGDEFNAVMENGNRLAVALADSFGVSTGELRNMAAQGKLTTDVVVKGLLEQGTKIGAEFANTTQTISQAAQTAGNNITKFVGESATVKSGVAVFNDVVVTLSENLDVLSTVLASVAAVMGSRYVGALTLATAEKIKNIAASRQETLAQKEAASAALIGANSVVRKASADKAAALSSVALAQAEYNVAKGSGAEALALDNLNAKKSAARMASLALAEAETVQAAAQTRAAAAAKAASVAASAAKGALALIGGPAGAAMLAASAIAYFYQRAQEARNEANELADSVNELGRKFQSMSNTELSANIAKLSGQLPELADAVEETGAAYAAAQRKVANAERELKYFSTTTEIAKRNADRLTDAQNEEAIAAYEAEKAQNRYSQTQNAINMGRATLNGTIQQGIDLLRRDGEEAGVASGLMAKLGNAINFASRAKEKFNNSSLQVTRSADADKLLDSINAENNLLSITDKRQRAVAEARQKAMAAGAQANSNQLRQIEEAAGKNYDLEQSEKDAGNATKAAAKVESQAEQAEKRRAQTLQELNDEMAVAELKAKGLNREAAQLAAVQDLGAGASLGQIQAARQQAGEIFDIQQRAADKKAALENNAVAQAEKIRSDELAQLDRQLTAGDVSVEQSQQRRAQIAADYTKKIAEASAQSVVTPQQELAGSVDPVQQLANENAKKLALIQTYEQKGVLAHDQAVALKNAADTQYEQQRLAALEQQYRAQSALSDFTMDMIDSVGQRTTNAITGIITGTQSATDALRNMAATILDQAVGALVQMGVQAMKNMLIGQSASAASVAQAAITGPAIAAAYSPAAAMVSLASFGANAAAAQAGIASTMGLTKMLSVAGARYNGGPVSANSMYRVGENGKPEIFQASNGSQYMIPGDNGRVVSNRDMQSGGDSTPVNIVINNTAAGTTVENQGYDPDTKTITLAVREVARQLRSQTGIVSRALTDSWNTTGKAQ
ncbi:tape measure protein [Salmonella enterica subsp. enterica]|nr:tape measure protein [Salmonella enterica subsp. enterica serovar Ank]EBH2789589.1 tape measure protein [Salmonella enterica subsp. enterica serovar Ank]